MHNGPDFIIQFRRPIAIDEDPPGLRPQLDYSPLHAPQSSLQDIQAIYVSYLDVNNGPAQCVALNLLKQNFPLSFTQSFGVVQSSNRSLRVQYDGSDDYWTRKGTTTCFVHSGSKCGRTDGPGAHADCSKPVTAAAARLLASHRSC